MPRTVRLLLPVAALAAAAVTAATGAAQSPSPAVADDPAKPLVYVFSLDALDGDRAIEQGRAPFLSRLVRGEEGGRSTYYRESRGIMVSETNPNHVAMATGAYGERSGIPGNTFAVYDGAAQKGCPADGGSVDPFAQENPAPTAGTAVVTSGEAATCLQAETFFTALERRAPGIVTAGIFGKPKLARIFETQLVKAGDYDADHLYAPCEQSRSDPPYCRRDPIDPVQRYTDDEFVMREVIRTVNEGVRTDDGAMRRPNLTFANFPDIDQAGHASGAREAYEAQIMRSDMQLKSFVDNQKAKGLWERTVVFFTSDHSMDSTPPNFGDKSLERAFGADAAKVEVVLNGSVDMVYLKDRNAPDRDALLKRLRDAAVRQGFVDEALYRQPNPADGGDRFTLDVVHPGWRIAGERTGDLLVTAKPLQSFGEPVNPLNGNHGAPQTLDHTFAIVSGGKQVRQQAIAGQEGPRFDDTLLNPGQAEQVDIAPTALALFGVTPPRDNQGRVLTEAFEPGALPPIGAAGTGTGTGTGSQGGGGTAGGGTAPATCEIVSGFRSVAVRPRGRGLRFAFARRSPAPVQVDVFRQSIARSVLGNRLVARFSRRAGFTWSGRGTRSRVGDGFYFARLRIRTPGGRVAERRVALQRRGGRFRLRPGFDRAPACGLLLAYKLERSVFGGRDNRALSVAFRLNRRARVTVDVLRGGRIVRRLGTSTRNGAITHRVRLTSERLRRGDYVIRVTAVAGGERAVERLTARRL